MDGPQYYRAYLPLREVNRRADDIETKVINMDEIKGLTDDELGGRDIYTMARMYGPGHEEFLTEIHDRGGVLVLDSDDDLTETYKLVSGRGDEFKVVLADVDYVTVSTQPLADIFGQYTKRPPVVLKNHVDVTWMQKVASKSKRLVEGLTIGFSGSPTHWGDWYIPAVPFSRILRDYDVTGLLHGEVPRYLTYAGDNLMRMGGVPFSIYPVLLKQFDIILCAVDSGDDFNQSKSAVKALEAMAIGVVPICSRFDPYMELEAAGAPIVIISEDSRDGWYEAMEKTVRYTDRRQWLSDAGPDWVRENRDMCESGYESWANFFRRIIND